jgi:hypothetical protein
MTKQPSYLVRRVRYTVAILLWPVAFSLILVEFGWKNLKVFGREIRENTAMLNDMVFQVREFGTATIEDQTEWLPPAKAIEVPTPEGYVEPDFL